MELRLVYGQTGISLDIPDRVEVDRFGLTAVEKPFTYENFQEGFAASGGGKLLSGNAPLIVVNDAYRNTPTRQLLEWLDAYDDTVLDQAGFLLATGAHAVPTSDQLKMIFGPFLERLGSRLFWHDATDRNSMAKVGTDRFGADVFVNRLVLEYDKLFIIGSVEPHYFAGFTGGRKSLFPGLTDLATIERNHNLANSLNAAPLKLTGNPVVEHLEELLSLLDLDRLFSALVVQDAGGMIGRVFFGPVDRAFRNAVELALKLYAHRVEQQYDLAIAEVRPPLDKNLYQAQKALENCQAAVADGGAVVIVSPCDEGVGSEHFFKLASRWDRRSNQPVDGVTRFGSHKLSRVNAIGKRIDVRLFSNLPPETVRQVFYEPVQDISSLISERAEKRHPLRLAVVHDAGHTVLQI